MYKNVAMVNMYVHLVMQDDISDYHYHYCSHSLNDSMVLLKLSLL